LALTSPTGGGRSVGIVRSRTKATEFSLVLVSSIRLSVTTTTFPLMSSCHVQGRIYILKE